jgi:DNA polymerase delta subunit 1
MIDNQMGGMTWLRVNPSKYKIRSSQDKVTTSQIEIDIENYNDLHSLPCEGKYSQIAPLRILTFDIECSAEKGRFP